MNALDHLYIPTVSYVIMTKIDQLLALEKYINFALSLVPQSTTFPAVFFSCNRSGQVMTEIKSETISSGLK